MRRSLVVCIFALAGCYREPDNSPAPSKYGLERSALEACANLRRIGCPEGHGSLGGVTCAEIVIRANALRQLPLECWIGAPDVVAAKGCGSLRCVK